MYTPTSLENLEDQDELTFISFKTILDYIGGEEHEELLKNNSKKHFPKLSLFLRKSKLALHKTLVLLRVLDRQDAIAAAAKGIDETIYNIEYRYNKLLPQILRVHELQERKVFEKTYQKNLEGLSEVRKLAYTKKYEELCTLLAEINVPWLEQNLKYVKNNYDVKKALYKQEINPNNLLSLQQAANALLVNNNKLLKMMPDIALACIDIDLETFES